MRSLAREVVTAVRSDDLYNGSLAYKGESIDVVNHVTSILERSDIRGVEIMHLEEENTHLRTALEKIADGNVPLGEWSELIHAVQEFADEALSF